MNPRILAFVIFVFLTTGAFAGPGANSPFAGRRVLIIGLDGCRSDAMRLAVNSGTAPNIAALIKGGTVTWNAVAGGQPAPSATNQATSSGPGWSSILTGVWKDKHLVVDNTFIPNGFADHPAFMRRVKEVAPTAHVASAVSWNPLDSGCIGPSQAEVEYMNSRYKAPGSTYLLRDQQVRDHVVALMANADPDVVFLHLDQADDFGHASGFSKTNTAYMNGIATLDGYIGDILTAMRSRPQYAQEKWCIIMVTDHGGKGTTHGGQSAEERTIWLIVNGEGVKAGRVAQDAPGHTCVPAIALRHLGIPMNPSWGMDPLAFANGPWLDAASAGNRVLLTWSLPGGVPGATAIEVWRDGARVASLPVSAASHADTPPAGGGARNYELRFPGSSASTLARSITLPGDLTQGLVAAFPFNGSVQDASGRGNHATEVGGAAQYVPGMSGQAVVVNGTRSLRLGTAGALLPDFQFGASTDFTIAFWAKVGGAWSGDPSFISNKNWASGANQGWFIGGQTNATTWQWNLRGASLARKDFDPSGNSINDGQWHHITVSHTRTGNAVFYHDGQEIGSVDISGAGNVDTAFPLAIGRDGNAAFAWNVDVAIDDLRIWRRALNAAEASILAAGAKSYSNWREDQFTAGQLADANVSGDTSDADGDGLSTLQEFAFQRSPFVADAGLSFLLQHEAAGLRLAYPQRNGGIGTAGVDYTADGLRYSLDYTPIFNPPDWQPLTADKLEEFAPPTDNSNGTHTVHLRLSAPLTQQPAGFVRLRVAGGY